MRTFIIACAAALALSACAQITERTGITPEQQLCLAAHAGNITAIEHVIEAGMNCIVIPAEAA